MNVMADKARKNGWLVLELPTGHDAMLTEPDRLAEILIDATRMKS